MWYFTSVHDILSWFYGSSMRETLASGFWTLKPKTCGSWPSAIWANLDTEIGKHISRLLTFNHPFVGAHWCLKNKTLIPSLPKRARWHPKGAGEVPALSQGSKMLSWNIALGGGRAHSYLFGWCVFFGPSHKCHWLKNPNWGWKSLILKPPACQQETYYQQWKTKSAESTKGVKIPRNPGLEKSHGK